MFKNILKETSIILLILICLVLVLGIIFYDFMPINKVVPAKVVAYTLPDEVKAELEETVNSGGNIVKTYKIDESDLKLYESVKDYDKGKVNPFSSYNTKEEQTNSNTSNVNSSGQNTNNDNITNKNTTNDNQGTFFNTVGK